MKLLRVDAVAGAAWVRRGFQVFLRHPLPFSAVFGVFLFVVFALTLVPLVGALALLALRWLGGDLGGGYFRGVAPRLHWDGWVATAYGLLGVAAAMAGVRG